MPWSIADNATSNSSVKEKVGDLGDSFVRATGQSGKLYMGFVCFALVSLILGYLLFYAELTDFAVLLLVASVIAALTVAAWICFAVRCPKCGSKIVWMAVRHQSANEWSRWLMTLTACPTCGFVPPPSDGTPTFG